MAMKRVATSVAVFAVFMAGGALAQGAPATEHHNSAVEEPFPRAKIDDLLTTAERSGFSGAVLVTRGDRTEFAEAYGMANIELGVPNRLDTKFAIWSLTKSFTATAIMQLVDKGELKLSDKLCRFISNCPADWEPITLRHLLSNTAGIPNYYGSEKGHAEPISPDALLDLIASSPLNFPPGEYCEYQNSSWYLLGRVLERATGQPYDAVIANQIFKPLGMIDSGTADRTAIIIGRASSYNTIDGKIGNAAFVDMSWLTGAASLYSTVEDLAKFGNALDNPRFLSPTSREAMSAAVGSTWWGTANERCNYGLGWWVNQRSTDSSIAVMRGSGGGQGFTSSLSRYPADQVTIILLQNATGVPLVLGDIEKIIFAADASKAGSEFRQPVSNGE